MNLLHSAVFRTWILFGVCALFFIATCTTRSYYIHPTVWRHAPLLNQAIGTVGLFAFLFAYLCVYLDKQRLEALRMTFKDLRDPRLETKRDDDMKDDEDPPLTEQDIRTQTTKIQESFDATAASLFYNHVLAGISLSIVFVCCLTVFMIPFGWFEMSKTLGDPDAKVFMFVFTCLTTSYWYS